MNLAKILLSCTKECNGHLQTEISSLSISDCLSLCDELGEETGHLFDLQVDE